MFNFIDVAYFPFIRKRSDYDLFKQIGGQTEISRLLPQFLKDFWWVAALYTVLMFLFALLYNHVKVKETEWYGRANFKNWSLSVFLFLLVGGFAVLCVRGGLQRVPIDFINAGSVTKSDEIPIVLNSPFTLIKSLNRKTLEEYKFYSPAELKNIYNPMRHFKDSTFKKQNVVILILESFSKEYTKLGNSNSLTPFLDSLMNYSLVFSNAYANGKKSSEGIPAVLASLPSLMENPFINSLYANNKQTSLATILGKEGYETAFFHGGINGTMNFDSWSASAGYKKYFGKTEYNNNNDFDNFWGIWDEPFLQFSVDKMSDFKEPFHSAVFTLSSHHPYFIPEKYKNKFPKAELKITESIAYTDFALRQFFTSAKKTKWYKNTLFIFSADHANIAEYTGFRNIIDHHRIPILFYKPDHSITGEFKEIFSQIDILPSALQLLGYNQPFFSFGQPFLAAKNPVSYFYQGGACYVFNDSILFSIDNNSGVSAFLYKRDTNLSKNIYHKFPALDSVILKQCRAFIQSYNHTLLNNAGTTE